MARKKNQVNAVNDPVFGTLEWEEAFDWWCSTLEFALEVEVSIFGRDLDAVLEARRASFVRTRDREVKLKATIARKMLKLAEDWRDEEEEPEPITLESFKQRISLSELHLHPDGTAQLFYQNDDVFADHIILVDLDANGKLERATIAG